MAWYSPKNLVTKYNPVAGTINAGRKLLEGDVVGAGSAFADGMGGGITGPLEGAGGVQGVLSGLPKAVGLDATDTKPLDEISGEARQRRDAFNTQVNNYVTRDVPQISAQEAAGTQIAATPETQAAVIDPIERARAALVAPAQQVTASQVTGPQDQVRQRQLALASRFDDVLAGRAPSVAQAQYKRNMADVEAQQYGLAAQARGTSRGALMLQAMNNSANAQAKGNLDAALISAKEQADARAGMGSVLDSARGQDIGVGTTNATLAQQASTGNADRSQRTDVAQAGFTQGANLANAGAANTRATAQAGLTQENTQANAGRTQQRNLAQGQLTQGNNQFNAGQRQDAQTTNAGNTLEGRQIDDAEKQDLRQGAATAADQVAVNEGKKIQVQENDKNRRAGFAGGLIQAGGEAGVAAITKSDERSKKDIEPMDFTSRIEQHLGKKDPADEMKRFLEELRPVKFKYKDESEPGTAPGQRYGVIAQDLERTPVGDSIVRDTPSGKVIDTNQAVPVLLASIAKMRQEMDRMRDGKGARR